MTPNVIKARIKRLEGRIYSMEKWLNREYKVHEGNPLAVESFRDSIRNVIESTNSEITDLQGMLNHDSKNRNTQGEID